jgi:hypothetical protein
MAIKHAILESVSFCTDLKQLNIMAASCPTIQHESHP